ncbi:MAG: hypothetical protein LBN30_06270 [Oscillospiraceae bacterium]|nr:hypothetical protein [Oscillospiraceae bacterium]
MLKNIGTGKLSKLFALLLAIALLIAVAALSAPQTVAGVEGEPATESTQTQEGEIVVPVAEVPETVNVPFVKPAYVAVADYNEETGVTTTTYGIEFKVAELRDALSENAVPFDDYFGDLLFSLPYEDPIDSPDSFTAQYYNQGWYLLGTIHAIDALGYETGSVAYLVSNTTANLTGLRFIFITADNEVFTVHIDTSKTNATASATVKGMTANTTEEPVATDAPTAEPSVEPEPTTAPPIASATPEPTDAVGLPDEEQGEETTEADDTTNVTNEADDATGDEQGEETTTTTTTVIDDEPTALAETPTLADEDGDDEKSPPPSAPALTLEPTIAPTPEDSEEPTETPEASATPTPSEPPITVTFEVYFIPDGEAQFATQLADPPDEPVNHDGAITVTDLEGLVDEATNGDITIHTPNDTTNVVVASVVIDEQTGDGDVDWSGETFGDGEVKTKKQVEAAWPTTGGLYDPDGTVFVTVKPTEAVASYTGVIPAKTKYFKVTLAAAARGYGLTQEIPVSATGHWEYSSQPGWSEGTYAAGSIVSYEGKIYTTQYGTHGNTTIYPGQTGGWGFNNPWAEFTVTGTPATFVAGSNGGWGYYNNTVVTGSDGRRYINSSGNWNNTDPILLNGWTEVQYYVQPNSEIIPASARSPFEAGTPITVTDDITSNYYVVQPALTGLTSPLSVSGNLVTWNAKLEFDEDAWFEEDNDGELVLKTNDHEVSYIISLTDEVENVGGTFETGTATAVFTPAFDTVNLTDVNNKNFNTFYYDKPGKTDTTIKVNMITTVKLYDGEGNDTENVSWPTGAGGFYQTPNVAGTDWWGNPTAASPYFSDLWIEGLDDLVGSLLDTLEKTIEIEGVKYYQVFHTTAWYGGYNTAFVGTDGTTYMTGQHYRSVPVDIVTGTVQLLWQAALADIDFVVVYTPTSGPTKYFTIDDVLLEQGEKIGPVSSDALESITWTEWHQATLPDVEEIPDDEILGKWQIKNILGSAVTQTLNTLPSTGKITQRIPLSVYTFDATDGEWLNGVTFTLYNGTDTTTTPIGTYTTGVGVSPDTRYAFFELPYLAAGTYTLKQTMQEGYEPNETITFTVSGAANQEHITDVSDDCDAEFYCSGYVLFVWNTRIPNGTIAISKTVDASTIYAAAHGDATFLFEITDGTGNKWVREITVNSAGTGTATIDGLDTTKTYSIKELKSSRYSVSEWIVNDDDEDTGATDTATVTAFPFKTDDEDKLPLAKVDFTNSKDKNLYLSDTDVAVNYFSVG